MIEKRGFVKSCVVFFSVLLVLILLVGLVSADFSVGNKSHFIENRYAASESVKGWINISLNNEPSNSLFQDSLGRSITLIDLLNKSSNRNVTYSCSPVDCTSNYGASNGEISKSLNLSRGQSKIFGLRFTGDITQVNSVNFALDSNAPESCENQVSIDILNDGVFDMINTKAGTLSCTNLRTYGCYNPSLEKEEYKMEGITPYCQKINLSNSPGFKIGAWINPVNGTRSLEASIYDAYGDKVSSCVLPNVTNAGQYSCDVNYSVAATKEFYVCVVAKPGTGNFDYKIRGNPSPVRGCGFFGMPPPTSSTPGAYEIFAEAKGFAAVGNLQIADSLPSGESFGEMVYNYIYRKYGSFSCTTECVVPIKFTSGANQRITIKDLSANYQKTAGIVTENRFYEITENPTKLSSPFNIVTLNDAGFSVPSTIGVYNFSLKLNNKNVVSQAVNVTDYPRIIFLSPIRAALGYSTDFKVSVDSSAGIKKFFWDFGDNKTQTTTANTTRFTYSATGNYKITITVTDARNLTASKTFDVSVSSPKDLINATIAKMKSDVGRINTQTSSFDAFTQESVNSILGIGNATQQLAKLEADFNSVQTEGEYTQIIARLSSLNLENIPKSVTEGTVASSITFFPERENINLEAIKAVAGGDYGFEDEDKYVDAVIKWHQENVDSRVTYKEILGNYGNEFMPFIRVFELNLINKGGGATGESYYLIMPKLQGLGFESGILVRETGDGGYVYVDVTNLERVSFYTTENVNFATLPAFISPGIASLSITDTGGILGPEKPRWAILILVIVFLLLAALVVYVILQEWYRKKYENHLFKNRNDLYNIVNYVHNSKKRGLNNKDIEENLRKAKWSHEQITYVMKKYTGERTGMFELPFMRLFRKNPSEGRGHLGHPGHMSK